MTATSPARQAIVTTTTPRGTLAEALRRDHATLQRRLLTTDALALVVAWMGAEVAVSASANRAVAWWEVAAASAAGLAVLALGRLYAVQVLPLRSTEIARLGWVAAASGLAARAVPGPARSTSLVVGVGVLAAFLALVWTRGSFRLWLAMQRNQGRFQRPVVVVGANAEGAGLVRLLRDHPEIGFDVRGVLGDSASFAQPGRTLDAPWLGTPEDTANVLAATGASGVIIAATAVAPDTLNRMSRDLIHDGVHVHVSTGLHGISHSRLRPLAMAHEPIFHVRTATLARWQHVAKRVVDATAASVGIVLTAPLLALAAVAIKLEDGGPVFFRQERVGRNGVPFTILKLRTMVPNAEQLKAGLQEANDRKGPLFKLKADPRRTRVGRLLEAASVDELPQLLNVLRGTMSLVGPRPPLPSEFEQFDDELRHRQDVRPGITGLWQVEARDNPSFDAYRRLDLFYVENWSITLDLAIILATVGAVLGRWWRS